MNQPQYFIDPNSTSQLLNHLDLAIDEAKLIRAISQMYEQVYKIETVSGPSKRTHFLRQEIVNKESQLKRIRDLKSQ